MLPDSEYFLEWDFLDYSKLPSLVAAMLLFFTASLLWGCLCLSLLWFEESGTEIGKLKCHKECSFLDSAIFSWINASGLLPSVYFWSVDKVDLNQYFQYSFCFYRRMNFEVLICHSGSISTLVNIFLSFFFFIYLHKTFNFILVFSVWYWYWCNAGLMIIHWQILFFCLLSFV